MRKSRFLRGFATLGAFTLCVGLALEALAVAPGDTSPNCELEPLGSRPAGALDEYRGRVVLVDFWASWCTSCAHSFQILNELERDFGNRGLTVIGVNVDEQRSDALDFLRLYPAEFSLGADSRGDCPRAFGVWGMPTSYLLDREGIVRSVQQGVRTGELKALRERISKLLDDSETDGHPESW